MKKINNILISISLIFCMMLGYASQVALAVSIGQTSFGFRLKEEYEYEEYPILVFEHEKTGAQVLVDKSDDSEKLFEVTFKTPAENDKGLNHLVEHCILSGSKNSHIERMVHKLNSNAYVVMANGFTTADYTCFPVSSSDEDEFNTLAELYVDSIFNPRFLNDERIFKEEGIKFELDENENLTVSGRLFNEINNANSFYEKEELEFLYPGRKEQFYYGGHPLGVLDATFEEVCETYKRNYHPSNCLFIISGDMNYERTLNWLDSKYLSNYDKKDMSFLSYETDDSPSSQNFLLQKQYNEGDEIHTASCYYKLNEPASEARCKINKLVQMFGDDSSELTKHLKELGYIGGIIMLMDSYVAIFLTTKDPELIKEDKVQNALKEVLPELYMTKESFDKYGAEENFKKELEESRNGTNNSEFLMVGVKSFKPLFKNARDSFVETNLPISKEFFQLDGHVIIEKEECSLEDLNKFIDDNFMSVEPKIFAHESTTDSQFDPRKKVDEKIKSMEKDKFILTKGYKEQQEWARKPSSTEEKLEFEQKFKKACQLDVPQISQNVDVETVAGSQCYIANTDVKDLIEVKLIFNINHLSQKEHMYLNTLEQLLMKVLVGKEHEKLKAEMANKMEFFIVKSSYIDKNGDPQIVETMQITTTKDRLKYAKDLFNKLLLFDDLADVEEIKTYLEEIINTNEMLANYYPILKVLKKLGNFDAEQAILNSQFTDEEYLEFLKNVQIEIDEVNGFNDFKENLIKVRDKVFCQKSFSASSIIAKYDNTNAAKGMIESIVNSLPKIDIQKVNLSFPQIENKNFIIVDKTGSGNVIARALKFEKDVSSLELDMLMKVLNSEYFNPKVMQEIGAYVMGADLGENNIAYIVSGMNPSVTRTLEVFDKTAEFIEKDLNVTLSDLDLKIKKILQDKNTLTKNKYNTATYQIMSMIKNKESFCEKYNRCMKELKNIKPADLKKFAYEFRKTLKDNSITIIMTPDESFILEGYEIIKNNIEK